MEITPALITVIGLWSVLLIGVTGGVIALIIDVYKSKKEK